MHPFVWLTRFFDVGTPLVHGGAQGGRADVQHADLVHACVKHPQRVLLVFLVMAEDFAIDEGSEHLGLQEAGQEGQIGLGLVGEEGSLEAPHHKRNGLVRLHANENGVRVHSSIMTIPNALSI